MRLLTLFVFGIALALPEPSSAQGLETSSVQGRQGAWYGLDLGLGVTSLSCRICADDRRVGTSVGIRGGLGLSQRVRLGLELGGWARFDEVDQYVGTITPTVYYTPDPGGGLLLRIGPTVSLFTAKGADGSQVDATSFGGLLGAGYEFFLGSSTALTPSLDLIATSFGSLTSEAGELSGRAGITLVRFGLGLTRH